MERIGSCVRGEILRDIRESMRERDSWSGRELPIWRTAGGERIGGGIPDCWLRPWLLVNVLACIVEEVEFFKEIDMGYRFPADQRVRRDQLCSGCVVGFHRVPDCFAAAL